jgi:hypothetical protein
MSPGGEQSRRLGPPSPHEAPLPFHGAIAGSGTVISGHN